MYRLSHRFNRSQRFTEKPILPERLQQLNRELSTERTKTFDYIYANRKGFRVRVCVMRDEDGKFFATAQLGKRAYRRQGGSPSGAFYMLVIALNVAIAQMTYHELRALTEEVSA